MRTEKDDDDKGREDLITQNIFPAESEKGAKEKEEDDHMDVKQTAKEKESESYQEENY